MHRPRDQRVVLEVIYSPSQTSDWKTCPVLWQLRQAGWRSRQLGKKDYASALGTAFAHAMHAYNAGFLTGQSPAIEDLYGHARGSYTNTVVLWNDWANEDQTIKVYPNAEMERLILKAVMQDPIRDWTRVAVEETMAEAGNARPDLIARNELGALMPVDYKLKLDWGDKKWAQKNRERAIDEWSQSDQLRHYVIFTSRRHNEPVTQYAILVAVLDPPSIELVTFWIDEAEQREWEQHQRAAWTMMDLHRNEPSLMWRASNHMMYGAPCEFWQWCFVHRGNELSAAPDYVKVPKEMG